MTDAIAPRFDRYVGIDYSGAQVATASLPGLRVYLADRASLPVEVLPPSSPRKYWTRRGIAEWLVDLLSERRPAGRSAVAEVYPSLWSHSFAREGRTADQHDAYSGAAWMRSADLDGSLAAALDPPLEPAERDVVRIEGWILGIK